VVVVKVELWPQGDASKAEKLGEVRIANDGTGTPARGNYNVELAHSGRYAGKPGVWRKGRVEGYDRVGLSPYHLVVAALESALGAWRGRASAPGAQRGKATDEERKLVEFLLQFAEGYRPNEVSFLEDMGKQVLERGEAMTPKQRAWAERLEEARLR
jgi:hypothetical protein